MSERKRFHYRARMTQYFDQENINPAFDDLLSSMKRNKKSERIKDFQIKREKSLFPNIRLPNGSFVRENSSSRDISIQIKELFQLPVPSIYCSKFIHDTELNHFYGIHLEYCVRIAVGASVPDFDTITGWLGQSNAYKEHIGFDLENELNILRPSKKVNQSKRSDHVEEKLESKERQKECLIKNIFEQGYLAGDYAERMEKEWAGPVQLQQVTSSKKFLKAGLYSKDYVMLELNLPREDKKHTESFKFPLPMDYGIKLMEKIKGFELDYMMSLFYDLTEV